MKPVSTSCTNPDLTKESVPISEQEDVLLITEWGDATSKVHSSDYIQLILPTSSSSKGSLHLIDTSPTEQTWAFNATEFTRFSSLLAPWKFPHVSLSILSFHSSPPSPSF